MNGNYPAGSDVSSAPWNEEEVNITAYCNANVWYGIKKDVELECSTTAVISGCNIGYSISDHEWENINENANMRPDVLIKEMADALEQYMDATKENPPFEKVWALIGQANGWTCDGDKDFEVLSEYCDY
jgi:hypothetical protein